MISSPTHHQRHSTESLPEHDAQILFALGKEEKVKRYSLYDKWTKKDNTKTSSAIIKEDTNYQTGSDEKEIKEEDDNKSWESNKVPSVNPIKEIKQGNEEVGKKKERSMYKQTRKQREDSHTKNKQTKVDKVDWIKKVKDPI